MKVYWISYEIKNAPQDAHLRVWKNVAYATALGARVRLRTLWSNTELGGFSGRCNKHMNIETLFKYRRI